MKDAIEKAVEAVNMNYSTPTWDADKMGRPVDKYRKHACPYCGFHRQQLKFDSEGRNYYRCERCEKTFDHVVHKKAGGPRQKESHSKIIGDRMRDLPDTKLLLGLSQSARLWLEWSHSSKYSGDSGLALKAFQSIRWSVYMRVVSEIKVNNKDDAKWLGAQLFALVEVMIEGSKQGRTAPGVRELASRIRVDYSSFSKGRRWYDVVLLISEVFSVCEEEIIDVFST